MSKIFRKMSPKFANLKIKQRSTIKYAIGEIVLVVIGILIALAI